MDQKEIVEPKVDAGEMDAPAALARPALEDTLVSVEQMDIADLRVVLGRPDQGVIPVEMGVKERKDVQGLLVEEAVLDQLAAEDQQEKGDPQVDVVNTVTVDQRVSVEKGGPLVVEGPLVLEVVLVDLVQGVRKETVGTVDLPDVLANVDPLVVEVETDPLVEEAALVQLEIGDTEDTLDRRVVKETVADQDQLAAEDQLETEGPEGVMGGKVRLVRLVGSEVREVLLVNLANVH